VAALAAVLAPLPIRGAIVIQSEGP
jgi:hypothetical protein